MAGIGLEVIDGMRRLRDFLPKWSQFTCGVIPASPFQTPQWLLTWWSHLGGGKLHVLVFRSGSETAGVVPCFLHDWKLRRQLTLIGTGISDYLDPVLDARHCSGVIDRLQAHLDSRPEWDVCDWQDLSADTPLRALGETVDDTPCSRIRLAPSFEEFLAARPHGLKRNLRRYREKLEGLGPLRFSVTSHADPTLIQALIDLHRVRWRQSGEPGMIDSNHAEIFVRKIACTMAAYDMLRIFTLHVGERVGAILMTFRAQRTIFSHLSAFDPEYEAFGCGRELLACALRHAHGERYRWWDFLRGAEEYKFTWGAEAIAKCRLRLIREGVYTPPPVRSEAVGLRWPGD